MKWFSIAAALVGPAQAGLRFGCSTLSIQRLDPLVEPGNIPSAHVHQIVGGNGFNATITTSDVSTTANCTTCTFSEDFSNYWTAALYFKARDGRYKRVPIYANADLESGIQGGMTIYYTQLDFNSNGKDNITAFQPGFRMTLGSPTTNTKDAAVKNRPSLHLPANRYDKGCWDGKNLDSPDHQSHMFSTTKGAFQNAGPCPSSHPIRVPQLAYETLWNTTGFNDKSLWPTDGSQPFVWSTGDDKGYSTHGDYIFGWKGDSLQKAMDSTCMFTGCGSPNGPLKVQTGAQQNKCAVQNTVTEDTEGWLTSLPGRH